VRPDVRIRPTGCPRCGCHLVYLFQCNCGAVHSDTCENCGRAVDVPAPASEPSFDQLDPFGLTGVVCTAGPVAHAHTDEERSGRVDAFHARMDRDPIFRAEFDAWCRERGLPSQAGTG
jgi:hypothetical protein